MLEKESTERCFRLEAQPEIPAGEAETPGSVWARPGEEEETTGAKGKEAGVKTANIIT